MKDNKLIAKFMGFKNYVNDGKINILIDEKGEMFDISQLNYKASWDWLMPVVDKIEEINRGDLHGNFRLCMYGTSCCWNDLPCSSYGETKIDAVYKLVIKFIKWYNKEKAVQND